MTHHCPRSNWTGPESELRRGICPKCAVTTLYEDCEVRPMAITFTDGEGNEWALLASRNPSINPSGRKPKDRLIGVRDATPSDLSLAGYEPPLTVRGHIDLLRSLGYFVENPKAIGSEIRALRALEQHIRSQLTDDPKLIPVLDLLKAIDEARK